MKAKSVKISELTPDNINANRGTQRGVSMLEKSLREYGAGRSVLVDKAGRIIAGNKTIEAAGSLGLENAVMVETDGTQVVVVKRTDLDLDSPQGRGLAIADNRVSEVGLDWDLAALEEISEGLDVGEFFFEKELEDMGFGVDVDAQPHSYRDELDARLDDYMAAEVRQIVLTYTGEDHEKIIAGLVELSKKFNLHDYADVVMELVNRARNS